jgi:hypothetical protein
LCGTNGVCGTWCGKQPIPSGVAASDYQCVDFDTGLPNASVWVPTMTQQGTFKLITAPALSLPNAFSSQVPVSSDNNNNGNGTITWSGAGATGVKSVSVAASINTVATGGLPSGWTGYIDILCASTGDDDACVRYTAGADTTFASGYTGLLIDQNYMVGPPIPAQCPITGSIPFGTWTRVEVRLELASGVSTVLINGNTVGTCNSVVNDDTVGKAIVGLRAYPNTGIPMTYYYDNVIATVRR